MESDQLYILQDTSNGTTGLTLGGSWTAIPNPLFAGSCLNPGQENSTFTFDFDGIGISLYGASATSSIAQVAIDSDQAQDTSIGDTSLRAQLYQSPVLSEGSHNITLGGISIASGTCLDFALIAPGPDTPLLNQSLIMDDSHPAINYIGDWDTRTNDLFAINPRINAKTLMNTTHQTSSVGAGLNLSFTGTSLTVFGVAALNQVGHYTLTYSIDGVQQPDVPFNATGGQDMQNFKILDTGPLTPQEHTLGLVLSDCVNQTLIIDYIAYKPYYDTLATIPKPTDTLPTSASTSAPEVTSTTPPSSSTSNGGTSLKVIVGFTVGFVVFLLLTSGIVYWYVERRKRRARHRAGDDIEQEDPEMATPVDPYLLKPSFLSDHVPLGDRKVGLPTSPSDSLRPDPFRLTYATASPTTSGKGAALTPSSALRSPEEPLLANASSSNNTDPRQAEDLRRRVDELTEEVERWQSLAVPPPAYNTL